MLYVLLTFLLKLMMQDWYDNDDDDDRILYQSDINAPNGFELGNDECISALINSEHAYYSYRLPKFPGYI